MTDETHRTDPKDGPGPLNGLESRPLPESIHIIEVGPRDGFQMESEFIPTDLKVATLDRLSESGVREIEATSFVHPRVIPQMADADEVMARIHRNPSVRYLALVPNRRGAERALNAGVDGLRLVVCATETYNQRNVGLSVEQSLRDFEQIVRLGESEDVEVSAVMAAAFGCPFEGRVDDSKVLNLAQRFVDAGTHRVGLGDSAGLANPLQIRRILRKYRNRFGDFPLWLHLHDTRGFGIANTIAALEEGVTHFDTSLGGLGGCPVMKGASGNVSTEDLLYLCNEMGIATGIELDTVRRASLDLQAFLGRPLASRVLQAGTRDELVARNR